MDTLLSDKSKKKCFESQCRILAMLFPLYVSGTLVLFFASYKNKVFDLLGSVHYFFTICT